MSRFKLLAVFGALVVGQAMATSPVIFVPFHTTEAAVTLDPFAEEVLELTNKERAKKGIGPLKLRYELSQSAKWMAEDMAEHNYFSHTDRLGRRCWNRVEDFGYRGWKAAGENIAAGQQTPAQVVASWMRSPGHRSNILRADYTEIGIGFFEDEGSSYKTYWVQNFGSR